MLDIQQLRAIRHQLEAIQAQLEQDIEVLRTV